MKNLIFIALAIILSVSFALAQPSIQWQKCLGGTGNDGASSVHQTSDGGYIVAGSSDSNDGDVSGNNGEKDYWVLKLNSLGAIEWQKSLGSSRNDAAISIQQTNDVGFIVAGWSYSIDGDTDYWIVKLTTIGTIEWQKSLGGSEFDEARSIKQTNDGGYIVAGWSFSNDGDVSGNHGNGDYWVLKLSSIGTIEWQKSLGGTSGEQAETIQQTNDGGFIVAGYSYSNDGDITGNHGSSDYWVVKLTNTGTMEWQKSLGGTGSDDAASIQQTIDGGYIVAGYSESNDGDVSGNHGLLDFWIVKLNSTGTIEWQKSIGGSGVESATSIEQAIDGGYVVAGFSSSNDGDVSGNLFTGDYWVVKLNTTGTIEWQKSIGGSDVDYATSIEHTFDGGFIVAGVTSSNEGDVSGNHGLEDYWVVKLTNSQLSIENSQTDLFSVFPNPAQNTINIEADNNLIGKPYVIYDKTGKVVLSGKINSENTSIEIGNLSCGVYLFSVGENLQQTFKIIIE